MPADLPGALSSENTSVPDSGNSGFSVKKIIIILIALVAIIAVIVFFVWQNFLKNKTEGEVTVRENENIDRPRLEIAEDPVELDSTGLATTTDLGIEKLSFFDFYTAPDNSFQAGFTNYTLPLNVKIDVINYYDLSRKINIDPVLEELNDNGFAAISNPWVKDSNDFFSIYKSLNERQIPILITSDFLVYYQQNSLKKVFKEIEENIFFDNLWDISRIMYEASRKRFEARLSEIGNINDPLLEASRLETVFFAVALELLKPTSEQTSPLNIQSSQGKFSSFEAERFSFILPANIKDEVEAEVLLIRKGKDQVKSPSFLYVRNYNDFSVPSDYRDNAKLNNFYLASKWYNSVFPLNYKNDSCLECLLDREDWGINFLTAFLIADDFYSLPSLKNRWARIYKLISFFKGLGDDLSYIDYRNALTSSFGDDYSINDLFSDFPKFDENIDKLAEKLKTYEFLEIQGAFSRSDSEARPMIGFRLLAEPHSPDNYIFSRLSTPEVGAYLAGRQAAANNISACSKKQGLFRCNGIAFDVINLIKPITYNPYFLENTNYVGYSDKSNRLGKEIGISLEKKSSNYWSTLSSLQAYLNVDQSSLPIFAKTKNWEDRTLNFSAAAWANLQTPLDKYKITQSSGGQGLGDFSRFNENSFVEVNLPLINELIANNKMILGMLEALRIEQEVRSVILELRNSSTMLEKMREIMIKEISGDKLQAADYEAISDFAGQLETSTTFSNRNASWPISKDRPLKADLGNFKLLILINQREGGKSFSVGPIWDYRESN